MVEMQTQTASAESNGKAADRKVHLTIPPSSIALPIQNAAARLMNRSGLDTSYSPVTQNGSFEFDRVIKSGYVQKRTQKTKTWKNVYLVLRPNDLSIYKSDKEDKLRHKIYLSDLTAVTLLKDPKHKRQNVFGIFSPARNFHFQASTLQDAQSWVDEIRRDARIAEEEEGMFLASPIVRRQSYMPAAAPDIVSHPVLSSSPEPIEPPIHIFTTKPTRRSSQADYSGISGNELGSHSDFSDTDVQPKGESLESLAVQPPPSSSEQDRPGLGARNTSQASGINADNDPDRVIWQGWLWLLRSKGGVRQWKNSWAVLRPRNLILYKDETEYLAQFILQLPSILNVVEIDSISKTKTHCLQIITEEKSYKLCAHDEESLVRCLGAFKSLLFHRRESETKAATAVDTKTTP